VKSQLLWSKEGAVSGSDYDYEQIYFNFEKPLSFYANNFTLHLKYGHTYKRNDTEINRLYGTYTLGGLFNLSGYAPYSFNDDNMALGVLKYRYQLRESGFFGVLNTPLYIGCSLESGNTWQYKKDFKWSELHHSMSVYMAADTFIGPFYFAYGRADDGENSFYLYLGEKF
jgi:NTE family protein